jgi:predicted Zn-ribbon and HTH transcriptional regulator
MLEFLKKRIFGRSTEKETKATVELHPGTEIVSVNQENMDETERESLRSLASELSDLTFFEGHIKHGYSLHSVSNPAQCPRCKASTQQQYANFIYATNVAPRVMLAPAGYFCTKCPTVICG